MTFSLKHGLTGDVLVRKAAIEVMYLLACSREGRMALREWGMYEVCRAWHVKEEDEDIKDQIENTIPGMVLTEEEIEADFATQKRYDNCLDVLKSCCNL